MLSVLMKRGEPCEDVWLCLLCHACEAVCPNAVRIPEIVEEMRRVLVDKGLEQSDLEVYLEVVDNILSSGVMMAPVSAEVRSFSEAKELSLRRLSDEVRDELREIIKFEGSGALRGVEGEA